MYRGDGETQKLVLWIGLGKMMESFYSKGGKRVQGSSEAARLEFLRWSSEELRARKSCSREMRSNDSGLSSKVKYQSRPISHLCRWPPSFLSRLSKDRTNVEKKCIHKRSAGLNLSPHVFWCRISGSRFLSSSDVAAGTPCCNFISCMLLMRL